MAVNRGNSSTDLLARIRHSDHPLIRGHDHAAMLKRFVDEAMDWMVLPGYSKVGYRVRDRLLPRGPITVS